MPSNKPDLPSFCGRTHSASSSGQAGRKFHLPWASRPPKQDCFPPARPSPRMRPQFRQPSRRQCRLLAPKPKRHLLFRSAAPPTSIPSTTNPSSTTPRTAITIQVKTRGGAAPRRRPRLRPNWKFKPYAMRQDGLRHLPPRRHAWRHRLPPLVTADSPSIAAPCCDDIGKFLRFSPCSRLMVNYGLGSVTQNLPGFGVSFDPPAAHLRRE